MKGPSRFRLGPSVLVVALSANYQRARELSSVFFNTSSLKLSF